MGLNKKNKLHNPQIVSETPPTSVTTSDVGRLWVDPLNNNLVMAMGNKIDGTPELRSLLDTTDYQDIDDVYYKGVGEEFVDIILQISGDLHYDSGYDFFMDTVYLENSDQTSDDFYAYYYKEVADTNSEGYLRTISTDAGAKDIRLAVGTDTYVYDTVTYNLVNYTKLVLAQEVKDIIEIKFGNKDTIEKGFILLEDKRTILLYSDPEGFFIGKTVKVKYLL